MKYACYAFIGPIEVKIVFLLLQEGLLKELAKTFLCTIFCMSPEDDISNEVARVWEGKGGRLIHVVSSCRDDISQKKNGSDVLKVIVGKIY